MMLSSTISFLRYIFSGNCHYSIFCLFLCCLLYGFQSSPTPDNPGFSELLIALLLVISVGSFGFYKAVLYKSRAQNHVAIIFMVFGLSVPVLVGTLGGVAFSILVRDVVAFVLFCLPIFLIPVIRKYKYGFDALFIGGFIIALSFSLRVLFSDIPFMNETDELLYLANSPLVLFYAIVLLGLSYLSVIKKQVLQSVFCFSLSLLMIVSMAQDIQRATLVAVVLSFVFIVFREFKNRPVHSIVPIAICVFFIAFFKTEIASIFLSIEYKTSLVGLNARAHELTAVWKEIGQNPLTTLFGLGWGSQFASPALGGLQASFTHSFLSYMLLKTGLLGLVVTIAYCSYFSRQVIQIFLKNSLVGIALFWAFVIPVFLYASYKSFDFGLVLTLIVAFSIYDKKISTYYKPCLPTA